MKDDLVHLVAFSSKSFDAVNVDFLEKAIDLRLFSVHFLDDCPHELNYVIVVVINTKVENVEDGHGVPVDVRRVLRYLLNYLQVELAAFVFPNIFL